MIRFALNDLADLPQRRRFVLMFRRSANATLYLHLW